jgi:nucleoside-diphosphate-sugar epimerase
MKMLVNGGAGFIGSHIVDACIATRHQVVVIDDLSGQKKFDVMSPEFDTAMPILAIPQNSSC